MAKLNKDNKNRGFILLLGILVATVLFSIGVSFSSILYKELILSFTARESQAAFYSSYTGIECIYYWDNFAKDYRFGPANKMAPFSDESGRNYADIGKIECGGDQMILKPQDNRRYDFESGKNSFCYHGFVQKSGTAPSIMTKVRSWGFNTCDEKYPRRTDRAYEVRYPSL